MKIIINDRGVGLNTRLDDVFVRVTNPKNLVSHPGDCVYTKSNVSLKDAIEFIVASEWESDDVVEVVHTGVSS